MRGIISYRETGVGSTARYEKSWEFGDKGANDRGNGIEGENGRSRQFTLDSLPLPDLNMPSDRFNVSDALTRVNSSQMYQ